MIRVGKYTSDLSPFFHKCGDEEKCHSIEITEYNGNNPIKENIVYIHHDSYHAAFGLMHREDFLSDLINEPKHSIIKIEEQYSLQSTPGQPSYAR